MLGIDKRTSAPDLLHLGNDLQGEGGFTRGFRAINFDHTPPRQSAHPECQIQTEGAGGDDLNVRRDVVLPHAHDGTFTELFLDLRKCGLQGLGLFGAIFVLVFVGHDGFLKGLPRWTE